MCQTPDTSEQDDEPRPKKQAIKDIETLKFMGKRDLSLNSVFFSFITLYSWHWIVNCIYCMVCPVILLSMPSE